MAAPFDVMVICLGNVCRSPLAEHILRLRLDELLGEHSSTVRVTSAGVRALVGSPMDESAAAELSRLGGDADGFVATQMTGARTTQADLVLTATRDQRSRVLEEAPRALKRTFTIREFAALVGSNAPRAAEATDPADLVARMASWRGSIHLDDYDVPDPIGRAQDFHRTVADMLERDCTVVARALAAVVLKTEAAAG